MNTCFEYLTITSINGVQQKSYQEMLQDAVDNVRSYAADSVPATVTSDIAPAIPHGYTLSVASSDPDVIAADGKVTRPALTDKDVTLTITISDGVRTSVSDPIAVTVKAVQPEVILTGSDAVQPESSFTAGISLNTLAQAVYAEDITLNFDPEVFDFEGVTGAEPGISVLRSEPSGGTVRIVAANIGGVNGGSVPILNIGFKVKNGVSDTSSVISVTNAKLGIPDGTVLQAGPDSKTITVGAIVTVDKSALLAAITAAQTQYENAPEGNEPGQYPAAARAAFLEAINAANAVYENPDATQEDVDDAVTALAAAKATFEASVISEPSVNKDALRAAIDAAEDLHDSAVVGIENGCWLKADKDAFKEAIDAANAVYADASATQAQVDNAVAALNAAKAVFEASVITASTGDINNSSTIDVGDLAIVAYYYGADSTSENWVEARIADINKDNKVDIEDLAFIASRILD